MNMTNDFYLVLPSDSCKAINPKNKSDEYTVTLKSQLKLLGKWEVALTEYSFSALAHTLDKPVDIITVKRDWIHYRCVMTNTNSFVKIDQVEKILDHTIVTFNAKDKKLNVFSIPPFNVYFKYNTPINASQKILQSMYSSAEENYQIDIDLSFGFEVKIDVVVNKKENIDIKHTINKLELFKSSEAIVNFFNKRCPAIFKSIDTDCNGYLYIAIHGVELNFHESVGKILGLETSIMEKDIIKAKNLPQLLSSHKRVNIYSNIAEPIHVGDTRSSLLKSIWVKRIDGDDVVSSRVDQPMYLPVHNNAINNINVSLKSDSGELIKFENNTNTTLTLHFRQI